MSPVGGGGGARFPACEAVVVSIALPLWVHEILDPGFRSR